MPIADPLIRAIAPAAGQPGLIDVADGIARVMGDRALFGRILRRFAADYRRGVAPIRNALDSGDFTLAHRLAHTLRGTAGMISAHALRQHAGALELALRKGDSAPGAALEPLAAALAGVLAAIEQLPGEAAPVKPAPHPPTAALPPEQALVAQLAGLLASGDGAAIDLLEQAGPKLAAALGAARFRQVALAANEFDFEGALAALGQAAHGDAAGDPATAINVSG